MDAMVQHIDAAAPVITRALLVSLFPLSALDKMLHWRHALEQSRGGRVPLGRALVVLGIIVELAGSACVLAGWHDHPAALALAGFCLVTAFLYHPFWREDGYWTADGGPARRELWEFLKDISVAGGMLLYASMTETMPFSSVVGGLMR